MQDLKNEFKEFMRKISNDKGLIIKIALIILVIIVAFVIRLNNEKSNQITIESSSSAENIVETTMYVDISGEVKKPGVYQFESGTRLYEVIEKAGGLTDKADTDNINQAEFVEDGEKILIPKISKNNNQSVDGETENSNSNGLININTASKEELMNITGVGEVIAGRIIEYRNSNRFKAIEDLMNVKGIGTATFEKMKSQVTV